MALSPAVKANLIRGIKTLVVVVSFAYVAQVVWKNYDALTTRDRPLLWWPLVWSVPFAVLYQLGRGTVWHLMVARIVGPFRFTFDVFAWVRSLAGKYIPGRVFNYLGRMGSYRGLDAPVWKLSTAYLIEAYASALSSFILFGLGLLLLNTQPSSFWLWAAVGAVAVMAIGSHPIFINTLVGLWQRLSKRPRERLNVSWLDFWTWLFLLTSNWLVLAVGFYFLSQMLSDLPVRYALYLIGAFGVAGWFGMILSVAPSGLGVREGVLVALLIPILPNGEAAALALLARLWITLGEAISFGPALLMRVPAAHDGLGTESADDIAATHS